MSPLYKAARNRTKLRPFFLHQGRNQATEKTKEKKKKKRVISSMEILYGNNEWAVNMEHLLKEAGAGATRIFSTRAYLRTIVGGWDQPGRTAAIEVLP
jgi:hypothetical protein